MKTRTFIGVLITIVIISAGLSSCADVKVPDAEDKAYGIHYDNVHYGTMFEVVNDSIAVHKHFKNIVYKLDTSVNRYFVVK